MEKEKASGTILRGSEKQFVAPAAQPQSPIDAAERSPDAVYAEERLPVAGKVA
jgi:hypothetical protein